MDVSRIRRRAAVLTGAAVLVSLSAATCSNSSSSGTANSSSGTANSVGGGVGQASSGSAAPGITGNSVTVGLLTSLTGPTAAGFTTVSTGFQARVDQQNAEGGVGGRKIKVVLGDDQGTTAGALSAAQTLVEQKNVFATGMISITGFAAAPYLTRQNVPVTGTPLDGPEWAPPNNNMFPTSGSPSPKFPAPTTYGTFFKGQGATNVAVVAYNTPTAAAAAQNVRTSAEAAGLKSTYINSTIPLTQEGGFGSIVQQMKQEHVDGIYIEMQPTANFALLEAMQQAGMNVKAYLMDISPPAAIFQNQAAAAAAQGTWVPSHWVPVALQTPAVKSFQAALLKYAHQTTPPDENEYDGWAAADLIIKGLQEAGTNPTRESFEKGLRAVTDYNAGGLLVSPANMTESFGTGAEGPGPYSENCYYYSQYKGSDWVPDTKPICGPLIPNSNAG